MAMKQYQVNTIEDMINYLVYLKIKYAEAREGKITPKPKCGPEPIPENQNNDRWDLCWCACGCNNPTRDSYCDQCNINRKKNDTN